MGCCYFIINLCTAYTNGSKFSFVYMHLNKLCTRNRGGNQCHVVLTKWKKRKVGSRKLETKSCWRQEPASK